MFVYNIQTINLYHNNAHIHSKNKKNCYHANRKDAERDHTDVKTSYLLAEWLLKTTTRKNEVLA